LVLYAASGDVTVLPRVRPYRDYLAWLAERDGQASLETWRGALDGVDEPTLIAPDWDDDGRPPEDVAVAIDDQVSDSLAEMARELGVTLNTVVQTAWGLLLARMTDSPDVVFGATVSGRPPSVNGIEPMVGLFINTVPVRVRIDAAESVRGLIERIQAEQADLLDHHHVGLPQIQQAAGVGALFDTLTVFESYPVDQAGLTERTDIDGMRLTGVAMQ